MGSLWLLLGVEVLQRVNVLPLPAIILGSIMVAAGAIVLSISSSGFRAWLTFASPAPVAFALIFLLVSPVSSQVRLSESLPAKSVPVGRPAPLVVVVLDEFPWSRYSGGRPGRQRLFPTWRCWRASRTPTSTRPASLAHDAVGPEHPDRPAPHGREASRRHHASGQPLHSLRKSVPSFASTNAQHGPGSLCPRRESGWSPLVASAISAHTASPTAEAIDVDGDGRDSSQVSSVPTTGLLPRAPPTASVTPVTAIPTGPTAILGCRSYILRPEVARRGGDPVPVRRHPDPHHVGGQGQPEARGVSRTRRSRPSVESGKAASPR